MSRVIGGICLNSTVVVRASDGRYRDMYGGAVVAEITVDGVERRGIDPERWR